MVGLMTTKTEFQWEYQPHDFLEAPTTVPLPEGHLSIDAGRATLTLDVPTDPAPSSLKASVDETVSLVFKIRQLATHRPFTLQGPRIVQHQADGRIMIIGVGLVDVAFARDDIVVKDRAGIVVLDTKAQRIADETAFLLSFTPKVTRSPVLRAMVKSYGQAVQDQDNELVHLYEVREAAKPLRKKLSPLGITARDWSTLGRLADDEPLRQGRHRGRHATRLRDATAKELAACRSIARRIIEAVAKHFETVIT
jgi:hypothetical protein